MDGFFPLHQDLGSCVRQAQPHESSTHQHGGGQQDGDSFGDADQGAKYQVSQDGRCFAQCVQEAKACCPAKDRDINKAEKVSSKPPRREWQPTPLFLPGEFHGQRTLSGCSP